jgi:hypothetical protein
VIIYQQPGRRYQQASAVTDGTAVIRQDQHSTLPSPTEVLVSSLSSGTAPPPPQQLLSSPQFASSQQRRTTTASHAGMVVQETLAAVEVQVDGLLATATVGSSATSASAGILVDGNQAIASGGNISSSASADVPVVDGLVASPALGAPITSSASGSNAEPVGLASSSAIGSPSIDAHCVVQATGLGAQSAIGDAGTVGQDAVAGLSAIGAIGSPSLAFDCNFGVSGLGAESRIGNARIQKPSLGRAGGPSIPEEDDEKRLSESLVVHTFQFRPSIRPMRLRGSARPTLHAPEPVDAPTPEPIAPAAPRIHRRRPRSLPLRVLGGTIPSVEVPDDDLVLALLAAIPNDDDEVLALLPPIADQDEELVLLSQVPALDDEELLMMIPDVPDPDEDAAILSLLVPSREDEDELILGLTSRRPAA